MDFLIPSPEAYRLFHEGTLALAQVEENGFRVDVDYLHRVSEETDRKIRKLETEMREDKVYRTWSAVFGSRMSLGSGQQLGHVFFEMMGFKPPEKKTLIGERYKTDEAAFDSVDHLFAKLYIRWKKLQKLRSPYLEGLKREICNGYIHGSYNLNMVSTFRSSMQDPNLQNTPVRNPEISEMIRRCFIPRQGYQLLEIDFKGIEVCIAACYHHDPVMIEYITDPKKDMHRDMAAEVYCLKKWQVSKNTRYAAKNQYVFPAFYGSYYKQMTPDLWESISKLKLKIAVKGEKEKSGSGISLYDHLREQGITERGECDRDGEAQEGTFEAHVRDVEKDFWGNRFRVYAQWKRDFWQEYQRNGSFQMLTGFVVNNLHKKNDVLNYAVQGSAFHCLLQCLIWLQKWLRKNRMRTRIVCQIHDSMVLDCHPAEKEAVVAEARRIMTERLPKAWKWICVPLSVEIESAPVNASWFEKSEDK